jgi:hypothetical protein
MRRLILVLGMLAVMGCGSDPPESRPPVAEGPPPLQETKRSNFTLYVSNQSFERDTVDIKVVIDGRTAVDGDFAVEDQHNWVEYRFDLEDGQHTLRAESVRGDAVLEVGFKVKGNRWAVVDYWCCNGDGEPRFTFLVKPQPIAFA